MSPWGGFHIFLALSCKFFSNLSVRFGFPYAAFISEKLGCSVGQFLSILAAAESTGLIVAIISPLFDSLGSWRMFLFGEFLTLAGLLLAAAYRSYWPVFIGFCLFEMGYGIIAPAFQTSVSADRIGRVTGSLESAWALAGLVGLPAMGYILNHTQWPIPFLALLIGQAPFALLLALYFPAPLESEESSEETSKSSESPESPEFFVYEALPDHHAHMAVSASESIQSPVRIMDSPRSSERRMQPTNACRREEKEQSAWLEALGHARAILGGRLSRAALFFGVAIGAATALVFSSFGLWLKVAFGFDAESVGWTIFVFGGGELSGTLLAGYLIDWFGLKYSVYLGASSLILAYASLALLSQLGFVWALVAIYFCYFSSEFTIISTISLFSSNFIPRSRGTMITFYVTAFSAGRMVGALSLSPLFEAFSFGGVCATASFFMCAALLLMTLAVETRIYAEDQVENE